MDSLTDADLYEIFLERAAVFEFDGGLSRELANYRAAKFIRDTYGTLPEQIKEEIGKREGNSNRAS